MAPERFRGDGDGRSDIYSLGATLYELATLRPAFEGTDQLQLIEEIRHVEPARPRSLAGCSRSERVNTLPPELPPEGEPPAAAQIGTADWKQAAAPGEFHPTPLPD